ncbi:hypothetical protein BDV19DRAFT_365403 [Aspergillus venezuelensis]
MPSSPLLRASYIAMDTPKLRYLLKILHDEDAFNATASARPRFIILAHWQPVLWVTEMFLNSLDISFVTVWLSPSMKAAERKNAITKFTAIRNGAQILLTNFNCRAKSLNLHTVCSRMVVMEPPLNMERLFEALGAIHQPGQRQAQKVWLLFQNRTFSRWVEGNNTLNKVGWVAARMKKAGVGVDNGGVGKKAGVSDEVSGRDISRLLGRSSDFAKFVDYRDLHADVVPVRVQEATVQKGVSTGSKRKSNSSDLLKPKKKVKSENVTETEVAN